MDKNCIQNELQRTFYSLDTQIGRGNFANVWKAHHTLLPTIQVAIKVIDKSKRTEADLTKIYREISILKKLRHPNIIKLYQVFESGNFIFLVTELCKKGELFDLIVQKGHLTEDEARNIFSEILSAVEHAHRNNVVHRDLKTENVLLDEYDNIKLADFGFGQYYTAGKLLNTWCGSAMLNKSLSPPYAAPEVFDGREYEGPELDSWSLGCILYVLVCGKLPFDAPDMAKLKVPWYLSNDCYDLIKKCLTPNPRNRIKISDVRNHKWLNNLQPTLEPMDEKLDDTVLARMLQVGIDRQKTIAAVESQSFNDLFALYHLQVDEEAKKRSLLLRNQSFCQPRNAPNHQFHPQQMFTQPIYPHYTPPMGENVPTPRAARRHTYDNVLSNITQQQHLDLQRVAQSQQRPHRHQQQPHHQLSQQQPLPIRYFPVNQQAGGSNQWTNVQSNAQQIDQTMPPPSNQRSSWKSGRRASDPFLTDAALLPLFEQINPLQLIHEAEEDGSHLWSSIRHPSTGPRTTSRPGSQNRGRPYRRVQIHPGMSGLQNVPEEEPSLNHELIYEKINLMDPGQLSNINLGHLTESDMAHLSITSSIPPILAPPSMSQSPWIPSQSSQCTYLTVSPSQSVSSSPQPNHPSLCSSSTTSSNNNSPVRHQEQPRLLTNKYAQSGGPKHGSQMACLLRTGINPPSDDDHCSDSNEKRNTH